MGIFLTRAPWPFYAESHCALKSAIDCSRVAESGTLAQIPQPARKLSFHQIWPTAVTGFCLGLTAVWICFLGYRLVKIVELMI